MDHHMVLAVILRFSVSLLLILGTRHILEHPFPVCRSILAATIDACMAAACLMPGFGFLNHFVWRMIFFGISASVAFGWSCNGLRCGFVFIILCMAVEGVAQGIGENGIISAVSAAAIVFVLHIFRARKSVNDKKLVSVEVTAGEQCIKLTALYDTGNTLIDPISGRPVLIIGADAACKLTGLSREQLQKPVETIGTLPGLRLVPYRTIGQSNGFLLAKRFADVKIGKYCESTLVAFAPENFGKGSTYQALTGGML